MVYTSYNNGDLGDDLWHCFTNIISFDWYVMPHRLRYPASITLGTQGSSPGCISSGGGETES